MGHDVSNGETIELDKMTEPKKTEPPKRTVTPADIIKNKIKQFGAHRETLKNKEVGLSKELEDNKTLGIEVIGAIKGLQDLLKEFE